MLGNIMQLCFLFSPGLTLSDREHYGQYGNKKHGSFIELSKTLILFLVFVILKINVIRMLNVLQKTCNQLKKWRNL